MANRVFLLGVPIDPVTKDEAVRRILQLLDSHSQHHVMTPNSEMLVTATHRDDFAELLRSTSINIPDSAGLLWAARVTGQHLPARVPGVDVVQQVCGALPAQHSVYLLGAAPGVAEQAAERLREQNPQLQIAGTYSGSPQPGDAPAILQRIRAAKPSLLLVAYGAPQQDFWINDYLRELPSVKLAMGVGGTFDFLAGTVRRAPAWLQRLHLEWLWRLALQPKRIGRIFTAVVIFPVLVLRRGRGGEE